MIVFNYPPPITDKHELVISLKNPLPMNENVDVPNKQLPLPPDIVPLLAAASIILSSPPLIVDRHALAVLP